MAADDAMTPTADDGDPATSGDSSVPAAAAGEDPTTTAGAQASGGPPTTMPSRRTALIRAGAILAILFVVFGLILPRFVDYSEVVAAFARADARADRRDDDPRASSPGSSAASCSRS